MATWYVCSNDEPRTGGMTMKGQWTANTAYSLKDLVVVTRASSQTSAKKFVMECTTAGTSHATTEPTWPTTAGNTVNDNGVVWTARAASSTDYAHYYLDYLLIASNVAPAAGEDILVFNTHSQSTSDAAIDFRFAAGAPTNYNRILCVSSFSTPALSAGATITQTGAFAISASTGGLGFAYWNGISFVQSGSSSSQNISLTGTFVNCSITFGSSSAITPSFIGKFTNCSVTYGHASQTITAQSCEIIGPSSSTFVAGATIPNTLFRGIGLHVRNCDLSNVSTRIQSNTGSGSMTLHGCKLHASVTLGGVFSECSIEAVHCDSGDVQIAYSGSNVAGLENETSSIYRVGGAGDGVNTWSRSITLTSSCDFSQPYVIEFAKYNTAVGSSLNATVRWMLDSSGTALKCGEAWLEVEYFGTSGSTLTTITVQSSPAGPGDILTPNTTNVATEDTTSTWEGSTTPTMQEATVAFIPEEVGLVIARLYLAKPSVTIYVDPVLYIS